MQFGGPCGDSIMVEVESNNLFSVYTEDMNSNSLLVLSLCQLFSLENLEKDYSLVMNMNSDLWVPLLFVSNLECVKLYCNSNYDLFTACTRAGLEISGEYVRKRIEIPRKNVYIRSTKSIVEAVKGIEYEFIEKESSGYILCCRSEGVAMHNMLELRNRGVNCEMDYVNTYVYLLEKVLAYVKNGSFIAVTSLFPSISSSPKTYSVQELKEIYEKSKVTLPEDFRKFSKIGVITRIPAKIEILIN